MREFLSKEKYFNVIFKKLKSTFDEIDLTEEKEVKDWFEKTNSLVCEITDDESKRLVNEGLIELVVKLLHVKFDEINGWQILQRLLGENSDNLQRFIDENGLDLVEMQLGLPCPEEGKDPMISNCYTIVEICMGIALSEELAPCLINSQTFWTSPIHIPEH